MQENVHVVKNGAAAEAALVSGGVFPFKLEDLKAWVVHRKDGTITRFVLVKGDVPAVTRPITYGPGSQGLLPKDTSIQSTDITARVVSNYSSYCDHKPLEAKPEAVFVREGQDDLRLWVGSMGGARATKDGFDFVVDCGDIFWESQTKKGSLLSGDQDLSASLSKYAKSSGDTRILKIDWDDRKAPGVVPEFWPALNEKISGDVMTCCVGGHGRSGTSFVCLVLVNSPDYDALDAIIHLRAIHCPRAIESLDQHEYINKVATFLGRTANAKQAEAITDYKAAFMASTKPTAIAFRKRMEMDK